MTTIRQAWKAVVAFLLPGLSILLAHALTDEPWTQRVFVVALLTAVVTSGAVYRVRNGADPDPTTSTPQYDRGMSSVEVLLVGILICVLLVALHFLGVIR
jgi:hypothetical protein